MSESSSGIATPVLEIADEAARRGIPVERVLAKRGANTMLPRGIPTATSAKGYGTFDASRRGSISSVGSASSAEEPLDGAAEDARSTSAAAAAAAVHDPAVRRTCLGLAVAYGGASGTLSGACLLLAKSGVELLVLTIGGENQFDRWQSWFLVVIMVLVALLQLWYLNKSLRLADPTLVCPLAFCFYNTSSIMLGLVYFDQLGSLPWSSLVLVVVGVAVLLGGVWTVSMHGSGSDQDADKEQDQEQGLLADAEDAVHSPTSRFSSRLLSPLETENATERDALLANVGGIGGPHLPPPTASSSALVIGSPESAEEALDAGPVSPSDSIGSFKSKRRARSRSGSGSFVAGLGMHVPGLPVQTVRFDEDVPAGEEDIEAAGSPDSKNSKAGLTSPRSQRRRRRLYEALLERGLSIGISPSSPGFHLRQSFEEENEPDSSGTFPRYHPRRTFSEADAATVAADRETVAQEHGELDQEEQSGTEQASSAWTRAIPALDLNTLSDRLARLTNDTRGWFGGVFQSRPPSSSGP